MTRRWLAPVVAVVVAATGTAATLIRPTNARPSTNGITVTGVESTATFCGGLGTGPGQAWVTLTNAADVARTVAVREDSTIPGRHRELTLRVGAHRTQTVHPNVAGSWFGLTAIIDGGGVTASTVAPDGASAPCASSGVTSWDATGLATTVGSYATLVLYNPLPTEAVANLTAQTASGFLAPAAYQGLSIPGESVLALPLAKRIVDQASVGLRLRVLRGALSVVAVERVGALVSYDTGASALRPAWALPLVTTVRDAASAIVVANPGPGTVAVRAAVTLGSFSVPTQSVNVGPFSVGRITISPNSAIPAHAYADVRVRASAPVSAALVTGDASGWLVSTPGVPSRAYLISDATGRGFDAVAVVNTSAHGLDVTVSSGSARVHAVVPGEQSVSLRRIAPQLDHLRGRTVLVRATRAALVVSATLPTRPAGLVVVTPLHGG